MSICEDRTDVRDYGAFLSCLGLRIVVIVICITIGFGCDRMSLNSLY